ncbi:hypothetical protein J3F84DRAFT_357719 [Trichoderma pleuroticola]
MPIITHALARVLMRHTCTRLTSAAFHSIGCLCPLMSECYTGFLRHAMLVILYPATGMAETQLRCRIAVAGIWRCHKATAFGGVETQTLFQVLTCASLVQTLLDVMQQVVEAPG